MVQQPDLAITKTDGQTQAQPGDTLRYTLTIRNTGPVAATGVVPSDTLPADLMPQGGGWTPAGGNRYTQLIGTVGPGTAVTRTMTILLPNPLPTSLRAAILNRASVGDDGRAGPDPTPHNNSSSDQDAPVVGQLGDYVWLDTRRRWPAGRNRARAARRCRAAHRPGQRASDRHGDDRRGWCLCVRRPANGPVPGPAQPATTQSGPYQGYRLTTDPQPLGAISASAPSDLTLDFGLTNQSTTVVALAYFVVERTGSQPVLRWGTLAERDTAFFRVVRATTPDRAKAVSVGSPPSIGSQGGDYRLPDPNAPQSGPAYYRLIEVEHDGDQTVYGPASAGVQSSGRRISSAAAAAVTPARLKAAASCFTAPSQLQELD